MIDDIFVVYENSGKYFANYNVAYYNSKKPGNNSRVYYVFTPTMQKVKTVPELENLYRNYFNADYFDINKKEFTTQLSIIERK